MIFSCCWGLTHSRIEDLLSSILDLFRLLAIPYSLGMKNENVRWINYFNSMLLPSDFFSRKLLYNFKCPSVWNVNSFSIFWYIMFWCFATYGCCHPCFYLSWGSPTSHPAKKFNFLVPSTNCIQVYFEYLKTFL